jgi:hypothetical protein
MSDPGRQKSKSLAGFSILQGFLALFSACFHNLVEHILFIQCYGFDSVGSLPLEST